MKPATIRRFDLAYLAWMALSVADFLLQHDAYVAAADANAAASGVALGGTLVTVVFVVWMLFMLLLWFLVSRRRSVVAKWVIVALVIVGVFELPNLFREALSGVAIVSVLGFVASVVAAWSLFGAEARAWFAGDSSAAPAAGE